MAQTRVKFDEDQTSNYNAITEKPLKFITDAKIPDRKIHFVDPENVDVSTNLRQQPTNLNYGNQVNTTELYGTAPYRGNHRATDAVDVESSLIYAQPMRFAVPNKIFTEEQFDIANHKNPILKVDSDLRGRSTRADLKNVCNPRK
tara:strand:- start:2097 stop:2531 length:435 start_codon:yes stop_codon:yes gene_type:complete